MAQLGYAIKFDGWTQALAFVSESPRFRVFRDSEDLCVVAVKVEELVADQIEDEIPGGPEEKTAARRQALLIFGVERIEALIASESLPNEYSINHEELWVQADDVPALISTFFDKVCRYRHVEDRDEYCFAAARDAPGVIDQVGLRFVGRTSQSGCRQCDRARHARPTSGRGEGCREARRRVIVGL